ncbi:MAG: hypothetical protein BWX98_01196 [Candidatus Aminicenantes bacterium ADurb.Bin147]|nr:MAG: hypothetical protein BWX98_01196 [Candidatus Aminicenantes bacterium ADurb.Bin147]
MRGMDGRQGPGHGRVFFLGGDESQVADPRIGRKLHELLADQDEVQAGNPPPRPLEIFKQLGAALARLDPAGVEEIRREGLVLGEEFPVAGRVGDVHPHADDVLDLALEGEAGGQHRPLGRGVEDESRRPGENLLHQVQPEGRLVMGRRDQKRFSLEHPQAPEGVVVEVGEEDEPVVEGLLPLEGEDEIEAERPLPLHPPQLVLGGVGVGEDPVRVGVERGDVPRPLDPVSLDDDAVEDEFPFRVLVFPGDIILGRRGVDRAVVAPPGQPLGHHPAVKLRAPHHFLAVSLDDEGDLHFFLPSPGIRSRRNSSRGNRFSRSSSRRPLSISWTRRAGSLAAW